jgi:glycosyltransferase involved in cell wall biosynthesis/peptidoglycan/xylan/chitin deacetylase (PgdA/CDA1 family)
MNDHLPSSINQRGSISSIFHLESMKYSLPLRIGILMDHPSPHMVELLDAIRDREDCTATVIYCGQSAPERKWGTPTSNLPYHFLKGITLSGGFRINPGLPHLLRRIPVDIWIVNSVYSSLSTLIAAWWFGQGSIPWIYMNEPPRPRNRMVSAFKSLLLQLVLQQAWGIIGMGERAVAMYRTLLHDDRPMASIPYYIHLEEFVGLPITYELADGQVLQFFTCCQMIHRKGLDVLLKACKQLKDTNWRLTLVGGGPLRRKLEKEFIKQFSNGRINFVGEVSYETRHLTFADKHVFILPSRWDGWGMVVPEALAAGLPVISTDQVISAHEFIQHGENGFIISSDDPKALAEKMNWFMQNRGLIPLMGLAARKSMQDYRPELGAQRMVGFLSKLVNSQEPFAKDIDLGRNNFLTWKQLTESPIWYHRWSDKLRGLGKKLVIHGALASRPRKEANGNRILVYHLVLKEDRKKFEEHLRLLVDKFRVCSVLEVLHSGRKAKHENIPCIAITFDDGFRVVMEDCLELLERFGIKACFYVPTGFVRISDKSQMAAQFSLRNHHYQMPLEPLRPEDLKLLVNLGHEVESHGVSHVGLGSITKEMAEKELDLSRMEIYECLGDPPHWVRDAGYEYAVTLRRGKINESTDPFLIPRDHSEGHWPLSYLKYFLFS